MNFVRFAVRLAGTLSACSLAAYLAYIEGLSHFPISDSLRNVALGGLVLWVMSEWEWRKRAKR